MLIVSLYHQAMNMTLFDLDEPFFKACQSLLFLLLRFQPSQNLHFFLCIQSADWTPCSYHLQSLTVLS